MKQLRVKSETLPLDGQRILELAARSMFDLFATASEGMLLVDREARVVWFFVFFCCFLLVLGFVCVVVFVGFLLFVVVLFLLLFCVFVLQS